MRFMRFILPFIFVRNWQNGKWEVSVPRVVLLASGVVLFLIAVVLAFILQMPVEYSAPPSV